MDDLSTATPTTRELFAILRQRSPDHLELAATLLDRGADINGLEDAGNPGPAGRMVPREKVTPLYDAARRGEYETVQLLLERGADVRKKNLTCMGTHMTLILDHKAIETLCGLDAMRTSPEKRIVELAEQKFGLETDEDFVRRRDAFDTLRGYYPRNTKKNTPMKPRIKKVGSVLEKKDTKKKSLTREDMGAQRRIGKSRISSSTPIADIQNRYKLRSKGRDLS